MLGKDLPSIPVAPQPQLQQSDQESGEAAHSSPPLLNMLLSPTMWAMCLAAAGVSFAWYFFPTWQPQYFEDVFGIKFKDSEFLVALPFLSGSFGCLIGGPLSDWLIRRTGSRRWGRSLLGLIGFTGAGLCVLGAAFTSLAWLAVALLCLAFLVNDLAIPCIWAVSADIGGRYVGTVAGIMNTVGGIGGMISPIMIPYVLGDARTNIPTERWRVVFVILAIAWFVSAVTWLFIDASKPLFPEKRTEARQA